MKSRFNMSIKLIFEANLKRIFRTEIEFFEENKSIDEIVSHLFNLCKSEPRFSLLKSFVNDIDDFFSKVLILINERDINALDGRSTIINDGDTIIFLPITHGG